MDDTHLTELHLDIAEHCVLLAEKRLRAQEQRIGWLKELGCDDQQEQELLSILQNLLHVRKLNRDLLTARLGKNQS